MDLNKVHLIGRVTKTPELKSTPSGSAVTTFGLATNHRYTGKDGVKKETVSWHNIVVWGKVAENVAKYVQKGQEVYVEGCIDYREWEKTDGTGKGKTTEIVAENVIFGQKAKGQEQSEPRDLSAGQFSSPLEQEAAEQLSQIDIDEEDIKPEDLPF